MSLCKREKAVGNDCFFYAFMIYSFYEFKELIIGDRVNIKLVKQQCNGNFHFIIYIIFAFKKIL